MLTSGFIDSLLLILMAAINSAKLEVNGVMVRSGKKSLSQKMQSEPVTPEAMCSNIKSCSVITIGGGMRK